MGIRIPQNQIVTNKYTAGKEYMYKDTYREYQGYYYELNNKLFVGKEFNSNAPELMLLPKNNNIPFGFNSLLTKASTYVYGKISNIKINSETPLSFIYNYDSNVRYFSYQINKKQIKEVNEDTFKTFQTNPLYILTKLNFTSGFNEQELKEAEIKIPGITTFVNTSYTNPPVEEDGTVG
jgi:hypothetical protein